MPDETPTEETKFPDADVVFVTPLEPPVEEPVSEEHFEYEGHEVKFSPAGECFISKDGQCLGCAAGVVTNAKAAKKLIDERLKGE